MASQGTAKKTIHIPREQVAQRAYHKWQQRNEQSGSAEADWYAAEKELAEELLRAEISKVAYRIWLDYGKANGYDWYDWFEAEKRVRTDYIVVTEPIPIIF